MERYAFELQVAPLRPASSDAADSATAKLLTPARELLADPVVQQRVEQTPALRESWSDPAVRRIVTEPQP